MPLNLSLPRLTVGATLAELTSLEQLLSVMEAEEPFHEDIVNKLWQVYSQTDSFCSTIRVRKLMDGK
jgi:hypothetical protein